MDRNKQLSVDFIITVLATFTFIEAIIVGVLLLRQSTKLNDYQNDSCETTRNPTRYRREIREADGKNEFKSTDLLPSMLYFPIYAQISDKSLKAICDEHIKRRKTHKWKHAKSAGNYGCGLIQSITEPKIFARRLNRIGGIVRYGRRWFETEYSLGYNVFEYSNLADLRFLHPSAVHSIDGAQFDGTDNTVCDGNHFVYYASSTSQIFSYHIDGKRSKNATIAALKIPIYKFPHSYVDLENDDGHLWILYHSVPDGVLKASLRNCASLTERKSWSLEFLDTKNIANAFIVCNRLYTITQNVSSNILNVVYDFGADKFFNNIPEIGSWKRYGIPSNVQYDYTTRTINIFENGIIYSIGIRM